MQIKISQLGRIKDASIDLSKKLTILTGQNNSGKTWVSYLIYGIFDRIETLNFLKIDQYFDQLQSEKRVEIDLEEIILSNQDSMNIDLSKIVLDNLYVIFKTDQGFFKNSKIEISFDVSSFLDKLRDIAINTALSISKDATLIVEKKLGDLTIDLILVGSENIEENSNFNLFMREIVPRFLGRQLMRRASERVYLMPAERIAINIFSKEMSLKRNDMIDNLQDLFLNKKDDNIKARTFLETESARYPQPISDALQISEDLSNLKTQKSEFEWLATEIEMEILNGKVSISKEGDFEFKPKYKGSKKLAIHLTGSVVKSFASLVFYFRHLAHAGDFIIIDEPEINLHPDNQVILARILAKIVNSGFKLMISTHSEYILKEINYFLGMKNNPEIFKEMSHKYGYTEDVLLSAEDLNVYLFLEDGKFKEIKVEDDGFDIETIDKVINEQSQKSFDIAGWDD